MFRRINSGFLHNRGHLYSFIICLIGLGLFVIYSEDSFLHFSSSAWGWITAMAGAAVILTVFTFQLPPQGNGLSLDSSVYLACIFIFGLSFTLMVLLLSSLVLLFLEWGSKVGKHINNFAIYCIMIASASFIFTALGGVQGPLLSSRLEAYVSAMAVYFILNTLLIGFYVLRCFPQKSVQYPQRDAY